MLTSRPGISEIETHLEASQIFNGDVSLDVFLRDYWQQKPLLIRQAFPGFESPLSPDELAGLACEDGVNSRLIIEKAAAKPWQVEHGPIEEQRFTTLPEDHWTLLVSDVEKHVSEAQAIRDCFRFIPDWRIDDLMFSYAPRGGSVGPHLDAYDVFLLQAYGQRNWKISTRHSNQFIEDIELSILATFEAEQEWTLDPGDMLYLPPGIAHHGVALNDCITCSIGFRSPSVRNMISEYAEHIASGIENSLRYTDANLQRQQHAAEITPHTLEKIIALLQQNLKVDDTHVNEWFGKFMTDARSGVSEHSPAALNNYTELAQLFSQSAQLIHNPSSRLLYSRQNDHALLFVDGNSYHCSLKFAQQLTAGSRLDSADLQAACHDKNDQAILLALYNLGILVFEDDEI